MIKDATELIEYLRTGEWIGKLSPDENTLLADFLKTSMAKQRKKVALAETIKDGVIYVVYKVKYDKIEDVMRLVKPGEIFVHQQGEPLPEQVSNLPRLAFTTLFLLGDIYE
jgi:hypothetical protein